MSGVLRIDFLSRDMNWWNLDREREEKRVFRKDKEQGQRASKGCACGVVGKQRDNHAWP